jgi:hypothetical protein
MRAEFAFPYTMSTTSPADDMMCPFVPHLYGLRRMHYHHLIGDGPYGAGLRFTSFFVVIFVSVAFEKLINSFISLFLSASIFS